MARNRAIASEFKDEQTEKIIAYYNAAQTKLIIDEK